MDAALPHGQADDAREQRFGNLRWRGKEKWCSGGDLNPHALRHTPLKRTCLPFHHPSGTKPKMEDGRSKMGPQALVSGGRPRSG
jgi:hypothetical protein